MELLRTLIVALFFAGVTVFSYYFLNSYPMPWEKSEQKTAQTTENAPLEPQVAPPALSEDNALPPLAAEEKSALAAPVASAVPAENPFGELPGLDIPAEKTASVEAPKPAENPAGMPAEKPAENIAALPAENLPPTLSSTPQPQVGADLASVAPVSAEPVAPVIPAAAVNELPAMDPGIQNPLREPTTDTLPAAVMAPLPPVNAVPAAAVSVSAPAPVQSEQQAVKAYLATAAQKIQDGQALEVLRALSPYYGDERFSKEDSELLVGILVQAATQVIYSQKNLLEPAYVVQPNDTLASIASKYGIPLEFIARVNGISAPYTLQPGQNLKVLRGPFNAMVHLDRCELVLTLNGLFAGRFWIGIGGNLSTFDGDFYYRQILRQGGDPNSTQFAFEFVKNLSQTAPGTQGVDSLLLHPTSDPSVIGKKSPQGNIILSVADMNSLTALLGNNSRLTLRSGSAAPVANAALAPTASAPAPNASTALAPTASAPTPTTSTALTPTASAPVPTANAALAPTASAPAPMTSAALAPTASAPAPTANAALAPTPSAPLASVPAATSAIGAQNPPALAPLPSLSASDPIASPVNQSIGTQASLPAYAPLGSELP